MAAWLITEGIDSGWLLWRDGWLIADVVTIREAMELAHLTEGRALTWKLVDAGFESAGNVE